MSSINPNNIDGTYPIAGQDNDSQGFRNNFTNIRNNLTFAKVEIDALEQNVILKSALAGSTLNNDMNNTPLVGAQIRGFRETLRNIGPQGSDIIVNWSDAHFQTLEITASIALTLANWPTSGFYAKLRLEVNVADTAHTLELPDAVDNADSIQGCTNGVITFSTPGKYLFEFSTHDSGATISVEDILRNYIIATGTSTFTTIAVSTAADIISNTASTSTTTGALKVVGGAGIVGDVFIGGDVTTDGRFVGDLTGTVTGSVTGSATTAATVTEAVQTNITSVGILTSLTSNGSIVTTSTTGGVGYATGAGGTVSQGSGSGKATTVTLNRTTGTITLDAASLDANASVAASFTLTNSTIADTDLVMIQHQSVGTLGGYTFAVSPSAGSAQIFVRNVTQTALAEAIVLRFAVIKSVNS